MNQKDHRQETIASPAEHTDAAHPEAADTAAQAEGAHPDAAGIDGTTVYVRRGRTPNLAFWVVLLVLIAFFAGALFAVVLGALSLAAIFNTAMLSAMVIGVPLAAVAVLVDVLRNRRRR